MLLHSNTHISPSFKPPSSVSLWPSPPQLPDRVPCSRIAPENQVSTLKDKGIPAEYLSSTQATPTKEKIHEDLDSAKPSLKLLYVTPELVATLAFMAKLTKLHTRGLLSLIAIDEAHCISTWGHDFRPSYRKLSSLRSCLPNVPILALTATAVPKVEKDVIESLNLQQPTILRASFNRANIFYEVRYKDLLDDTYTDLSNLLKTSANVCSIIYCLERSTCDDLSGHLSKTGISSAAYHAGLNNKIRTAVLDDWLSSRIQVVVATVAFGMGIDKKDVRIVCHFNIPKSMEAFYQESGRAGRDQLPSRSVLYYGLDDRKRMEFILSNAAGKRPQSSSSSDSLLKKSLADFKQMVEYCEGSGCRRKKILESFGEQVPASFCQKSCDACKHINNVSKRLEELNRLPNIHKKDGLAPVFKSTLTDISDCRESEFWNRDDEASCSDEDISNSDDGADAISSLGRSKTSSKIGLDEKFEALQHAEEVYYQKKNQKKQCSGLPDKKAISETLREANKKRLLNAMNQAQKRLGKLVPDAKAWASNLEMECFKKYDKVGKTFYSSQVAATLRWLSSSSYEQINDRLDSNSSLASANGSQKYVPNATSSSLPYAADVEGMQSKTSKEEIHENVQIERSCNTQQSEISRDKIKLPPILSFSEFQIERSYNNTKQSEISREKIEVELPPILSFSEFVNQKEKEDARDGSLILSQNTSSRVQKRVVESDENARGNAEKKMKQSLQNS